MFDGKAFGEEIVGIVQDYLEREVAPLKAENAELKERIAELEGRPIGAPMDEVKGVVEIMISDAFVIRAPKGEAPTLTDIMEEVRPATGKLISEAVAEAIAELPPPEKGEKGDDGHSVTADDVAPLIASEIAKAVAAIPAPKDGKDGLSVKGMLVDRAGHLRCVMTDGTDYDLGEVVGKDGAPGKDGRDGFGFEDMDACVLDDDRTIELSFRRGEEEKAFTFKWPTVIYRNVFKEGEQYQPGDMVTWGGSLWHCDKATTQKPGTEDWTLACKKGRDGKDKTKE